MTVYEIVKQSGFSYSQQDVKKIGGRIAFYFKNHPNVKKILQTEVVAGEYRQYEVFDYPEESVQSIKNAIMSFFNNGYSWD